MLTVALLTAAAHACSCVTRPPVVVSPLPGSVDVPRNARIRLLADFGWDGGVPELRVDGAPLDAWDLEIRSFGQQTLVEFVPSEVLPPGATVEVLGLGASWSFHVGDDSDVVAPVWDGRYEVDSVDAEDVTCGRHLSHAFHLRDVTDGWSAEETLAVLEPSDVGVEAAGTLDFLVVADNVCTRQDPTLREGFHRAYEVYLEDGSGNVAGPFPIRTGCGCAASGGPGLAGALAVGLGGVGRRRQSGRRCRGCPTSKPEDVTAATDG